MCVLLLMQCPIIGPFICRVVGSPKLLWHLVWFCVQGAYYLNLCKMAFQLSSKVVDLHLDNSTAKAFLCHQGGRASLFLYRLACYILNLANKCGITLIPTYIHTHLNVEAIYLFWERWVPERHLLPHAA